MRKHLLLSVLLLPGLSYAQNAADLQERLRIAAEPFERAGLLLDLARTDMQAGRTTDALERYHQCIQACEEADLLALEARCHLEVAEHYATLSPAQALQPALEAFELSTAGDSAQHAQSAALLADLFMRSGSPQRALDYLEGQPSLAQQADLKELRMRALAAVGRRSEARAIGEAMLAGKPVAPSPEMSCRTIGTLACIAEADGDDARGIALERDLIERALAIGHKREAAVACNNSAQLMARKDQLQPAIAAYQRALTLLPADDTLRDEVRLNMAVVHGRSRNFTEAFALVNDVTGEARSRNSLRLGVRAALLDAGLRVAMGDYSSALPLAEDARLTASAKGMEDLEAQACDILSEIAKRQGRADEAIQYAHLVTELRAHLAVAEANSAGAEDALREEKRVVNAIRERLAARSRYHDLMVAAQDQQRELDLAHTRTELETSRSKEADLARERTEQALALSRSRLDAEIRERTIRDLENRSIMQSLRLQRATADRKEQDNALQLLTSRNELLASQSKLKQVDNARQRLMVRSTLCVLAAVALFGLLMWGAFARSRRNNQLISAQQEKLLVLNEVVSDRNKELMSSLTYASHIQSSIVPTMDDLHELQPGSFLFYRPQAEVSGDLPFLRRKGDKMYVAAIDCTGHGVPAAMLSFIAYYNLNQIIGIHQDEPSGRILGLLHERVHHTMHARNGPQGLNDGMDMGLAVIDLATGTLQFSGAQNSALLFTGTGCEVLRGSIRSIGDGMQQGPPVFDTQERTLLAGDRLYLYTDGVVHQFGGEDGQRKFTARRLRDLLGEDANLTGVPAVEKLARSMDAWQGEHGQTDDMLLIGINFSHHRSAVVAA